MAKRLQPALGRGYNKSPPATRALSGSQGAEGMQRAHAENHAPHWGRFDRPMTLRAPAVSARLRLPTRRDPGNPTAADAAPPGGGAGAPPGGGVGGGGCAPAGGMGGGSINV